MVSILQVKPKAYKLEIERVFYNRKSGSKSTLHILGALDSLLLLNYIWKESVFELKDSEHSSPSKKENKLYSTFNL